MLTVLKISNKADSAEIRKSALAQIVFGIGEKVDAFIYTFSLTIHSFVPFQQFMSDNQKLDYHCDMCTTRQRHIGGWSLVYNIWKECLG